MTSIRTYTELRVAFPKAVRTVLVEAGYIGSQDVAIHIPGQLALMVAFDAAFFADTDSGRRYFVTLRGSNAEVAAALGIIDSLCAADIDAWHLDSSMMAREDDAAEMAKAEQYVTELGEARAIIDDKIAELDEMLGVFAG